MRVSNRNAAEYIEDRKKFTNHGGSFSGREVTRGEGRMMRGLHGTIGRLDYNLTVLFEDTMIAGGYVVESYATPIAWFSNDLGWWIIPDEKYSVTTSRHQNIARNAVRDYETA